MLEIDRLQVDVALSRRPWRKGSRYALEPVLVAAPRSEDGQCDTDVQTLGSIDDMAHASLPEGMLRM